MFSSTFCSEHLSTTTQTFKNHVDTEIHTCPRNISTSATQFKPNLRLFVSLFLGRQPPVAQGLLIHEISVSHKTHHSRYDSSGRVISTSQRPLPDNTQHSQQTNIHAPCGIRTHNLSRRAAAGLHLRPRGHWDRQTWVRLIKFNKTHQDIKFHENRLARSGAIIKRQTSEKPCGYGAGEDKRY